ncbi:MAG: OmpH family outer membrane protein [candidate division KSB1 bacterium]|nr:OmpH family outer membrane protein [candidate division KSB1 bacterium]
MKFQKSILMALVSVFVLAFSMTAAAQKLGYVNSNQILAEYKEAQDAQEQLDKLNREWEEEARQMQQQFQQLGQQLESQKLLLSEERQQEKQQELQALYQKIQQYQNQKWGQNGEFYQRQDEIMQPIIEKINTAIRKVGEEEEYDYIFDTVSGNIVYVGENQRDLTQLVLDELEQGLESSN